MLGRSRRSGVMIQNHTSFEGVLKHVLDKYSALFRYRAFVFRYMDEGMDEM